MRFQINVDNTNPKFKVNKNNIRKLVKTILVKEKKDQAEIGVIFVDHKYIIDLNKEFLGREDTTDVLSFPYTGPEEIPIIGEIYVNLDITKENAKYYEVPFEEEMNRIVIHGVLHLLGYDDQTKTDKMRMTEREEYFLSEVF